jgi:D-inositol-3-phosphate glycosyltransferase
MRIALITELPAATPAAGDTYPAGPAAQLGALATALTGLGAEVTVHAPSSPAGSGKKPAGPARARPGRAGGQPRRQQAAGPGDHPPDLQAFTDDLAGRWRRQAPDVVHAWSWPAGVAALAARRGLGLTAVQTFHSAPGSAARDGNDPARVELALARAAAAVLVGTSDTGAALRRLGVPRAAIRVVPAGVDTARFTPAGPVAPRGQRARLLMVAGLADDPGPGTAVRALPEIPEAELVIAGGPDPSELDGDPGYQALMQLAARLGVADRVSVTGPTSLEAMPTLMRSADLLLNLGTEEPQEQASLEAMACGVPVVAAAAGLHADAVINGTTGLLISPDQPRLLAGRVRQLLGSPMREGMAIAAASRAAERYSWARIGQETLAVYEGAAQHSGAPAR